jgi:hypothetical protein
VKKLPELDAVCVGGSGDLDGSTCAVGLENIEVVHPWPTAIIVLLDS